MVGETIDWERYWQNTEDRTTTDASPSAEYTVEPLLSFLAERGPPESYADVGCGPGATVFAVADAYPEATVVGYDGAESVLCANRERANEEGYGDVRFERAVLPGFDPGRQFDVVSCFFTLCYVADAERALRNLYDAVAPGGALVVTYHNRFARAYYRRVANDPEPPLDGSAGFDPDRFADRFRLVIEGENLLSYERIHEALGTWPRSVWSVAESADRYGASRAIPLVYVPK